MLVNRNMPMAPMLWYSYRLMKPRKQENNSSYGGYSLTLYEDGAFVYEAVDGLNNRYPLMFRVPQWVVQRCGELLKKHAADLDPQMRDIRSYWPPEGVSVVGVEDRQLFRVQDIDKMKILDYKGAVGLQVRHMSLLIEDLAFTLDKLGFNMEAHQFGWKWDKVQHMLASDPNPPPQDDTQGGFTPYYPVQSVM